MVNNNNANVFVNTGNGMFERAPKNHYFNRNRGKWMKKPANNNSQQKPHRRMRNRLAHAFRRHVGTTVNGKNVYRGIRGGLFTANGTPVHNRNGKWTTN